MIFSKICYFIICDIFFSLLAHPWASAVRVNFASRDASFSVFQPTLNFSRLCLCLSLTFSACPLSPSTVIVTCGKALGTWMINYEKVIRGVLLIVWVQQ